MKKTIMKTKNAYWFDALRLILFLLTVLIMVNHEHLTEQLLIIDADDDYNRFLTDDTANNGGNSSAEWLNFKEKSWRCNLGDKYQYYYCLEVIQMDPLADSGTGADFSKFSEVEIFYDYSGLPTDSLRLLLMNFNPKYSQSGLVQTQKINEFEFRPQEFGSSVRISFDKFSVPNWWTLEQNVPSFLAETEFSNIVSIHIQTGSKDSLGEKNIQIQRMVFKGQSISAESLYQAVLLFWLVFFAITGTFRLFMIAKELRHERAVRAELDQELNSLSKIAMDLETTAYTDTLTGVLNRAGFEKVLKTRRDSADLNSYGMLVIDLDHFKNVNDTLGHQVGDEVLSKLGALLRNSRRQDDIVARWGGEEFVLLVSTDTLQKARALAEKLRWMIASETWPQNINITVSIGVAMTSEGEDMDAVFTRADTELYKAKSKGRNQVCG